MSFLFLCPQCLLICEQAPNWLTAAMQAMQAKYTNDKFEVILRKVTASTTPEWRIKCLDCPGKVRTSIFPVMLLS